MKAQPALSRVHVYDGTSSSSSGGNGRVPITLSAGSEDERPNGQSTGTSEAELRLHSADYVEARGILLPATDFLSQAVSAAEAQGSTTGDLLSLVGFYLEFLSGDSRSTVGLIRFGILITLSKQAAEAYMSLGNVSYTRTNEAYFRQALTYLRSTTVIPGYELPIHLQR